MGQTFLSLNSNYTFVIIPIFFLGIHSGKKLKFLEFIIILSEFICVSRNSYIDICKLILLLNKYTYHFLCTFHWCTGGKLDYGILTNLSFISTKTEPFPKFKSYQLGKWNLERHLEALSFHSPSFSQDIE